MFVLAHVHGDSQTQFSVHKILLNYCFFHVRKPCFLCIKKPFFSFLLESDG